MSSPEPTQSPAEEERAPWQYDEMPPLTEFFRNGGMIGVNYIYICPDRVTWAMRKENGGWEGTNPGIAFEVRGVPATVMCRGRPIRGAPIGSARPGLKWDRILVERVRETGWHPRTDEAGNEWVEENPSGQDEAENEDGQAKGRKGRPGVPQGTAPVE